MRWTVPARACALIVLVGLAGASCGKASEPQEAPEPVTTESADSDLGAAGRGAPGAGGDAGGSAPSTPGCPPSRTGFSCERQAYWGRNLDTGTCCEYPSACEVPFDMPRFPSEEECRTDCRCAQVERVAVDGEVLLGTERISLECNCQGADCPANLEDATRRICAQSAEYATLVTGCGMAAIEISTGYGFARLVFDAASGALTGMTSSGDTPSQPCMTVSTVAGQEFECDEITRCRPCDAASMPDVPRCQ